MATPDLELDALRDLHEQAHVISQLAKDDAAFTAAYEAFRAGDSRAFHTALEKVRVTSRCRLVCEWIRIKECVFVCLKLCGEPRPADHAPNPRELAEAIVRITSDERLVRQLAESIERRDKASFQRVVEQFRLGHLCHFFCHWLCI